MLSGKCLFDEFFWWFFFSGERWIQLCDKFTTENLIYREKNIWDEKTNSPAKAILQRESNQHQTSQNVHWWPKRLKEKILNLQCHFSFFNRLRITHSEILTSILLLRPRLSKCKRQTTTLIPHKTSSAVCNYIYLAAVSQPISLKTFQPAFISTFRQRYSTIKLLNCQLISLDKGVQIALLGSQDLIKKFIRF